MLQRLVYGLLLVVCFATGSLGAFMMFRWPALLRTVILDYLIALVVTRLCLVALRFLLAPNADRLRLVPLSTRTAWFWYRGLSIAAGVAAFGWQTVSVLQTFAVPDVTLDSLRLLVGLAMVLVGVALAWLAARLPHDGNGGRLARSALPAVATLGLPFLWLVFVAGLGELGWTIGVLAALPVAIYVARHAAATVVRSADATPGHGVALERAAQILVVVVAALAVMRAWHADLWALSIGDTPGPRLVRGVVEAVAIVLLTDLAWRAIRARIDHHLDLSVPDAMLDEAEAHRRSRVRTLLPVLRNALLIVLLALASLSALSAIGLRIGPLLAGAGIAGIALGLGAQTLVRDVISGIFFLLDDAFRVGEYIESGAISGTVEAFSLRSIMLRHYKGQLHTVPFGDLKTVTNYSRTWMAAELEILVTHEVDLEAVEAAIREVSEALSAEPELAGFIIDPLRSLGATAITESAIRFGAIIKVKAGQQFAARRLGYAHVRAVFAVRRIPLAAPRLHIETRPHGVAGSGA
ncbi:MAG: mechanosensitive ion channel domain-containing protein [Acetobacteraceae bacterium]